MVSLRLRVAWRVNMRGGGMGSRMLRSCFQLPAMTCLVTIPRRRGLFWSILNISADGLPAFSPSKRQGNFVQPAIIRGHKVESFQALAGRLCQSVFTTFILNTIDNDTFFGVGCAGLTLCAGNSVFFGAWTTWREKQRK